MLLDPHRALKISSIYWCVGKIQEDLRCGGKRMREYFILQTACKLYMKGLESAALIKETGVLWYSNIFLLELFEFYFMGSL